MKPNDLPTTYVSASAAAFMAKDAARIAHDALMIIGRVLRHDGESLNPPLLEAIQTVVIYAEDKAEEARHAADIAFDMIPRP